MIGNIEKIKNNIDMPKKEYANNYHDETTSLDYTNNSSRPFPTGDKNKDLMILIGKAITKWSEIYDLEGMPKKIILGQVLTLLNSWYKDLR